MFYGKHSTTVFIALSTAMCVIKGRGEQTVMSTKDVVVTVYSYIVSCTQM